MIASIRLQCTISEINQIFRDNYIEIISFLSKKNIDPISAPVAIFHNIDDQEVDIEAGIPIPRPIKGKGRIKQSEIPGGKVAYTLYTGAYDKIKPAYDAIKSWLKAEGYKTTGLSWEIYLTDPRHEPDQNKLKTEIFWKL